MSSRYTPSEMAQALGAGLLSFPVTHFDADMAFDEPAYRSNLDWLSSHPAAGLFAAGGTGELFSLTLDEVPRSARGRDPDRRAHAGDCAGRLRHRDCRGHGAGGRA